MATTIVIHGKHRTLTFAARELAKYLGKATRTTVAVSRQTPKRRGQLFRIGLCEEFKLKPPTAAGNDADWICVRRCTGGYILTGSNPRSVLYAVYRYLHELGFRWIRPGRRGEIIPRIKTSIARGVSINETASYPYRTICIEGACSQQHVIDLIDWMAKHRMNGYFVQFDYGTCFFERWYKHLPNRYMKREKCHPPKIIERIIRQLQKRSMRFERMGHGWTCAPLNIAAEGWETTNLQLPPSKRHWLAKINGKRQLWRGVPLNTNLCYSNPKVRHSMSDAIVEYAIAHDEVDVLHLWLADGSNNNCECAECRKARPADFYVHLLNELDEKLTAAGLDIRIVFLIYVDLLWPPQRARIANQDRFILMFAPITRSYTESFADSQPLNAKMSPYVRNKLSMPHNVHVNIQYLHEWRRIFTGDGFDFDYHLIWSCYRDPNMISISRVLHKDMQNLQTIGLHGMNSCQNQRMSFPHNLPMDVMARTLWNKRTPFRTIMTDSFNDAYGQDGALVAEFFEKMSALWLPFYRPIYEGKIDKSCINRSRGNLAQMPELIRQCRKLAKRNHAKGAHAVQWSWKYLNMYLDLLELLLPAFEAYLNGDNRTECRFKVAFDFLWRNERTLHPALDVPGFVKILTQRITELQAWLSQQDSA